MKRKVIKLGPATLVVSLPTKWVKNLSVKSGDYLEVDEQNKDLVIKTKNSFGSDKEILDLTNTNKLLRRIITARYFNGVDEIDVKVDSSEKLKVIQKRVSELIGMEIVEQSKNKILIKNIQGENIESFDTLFRRVFFLIDSLSDETLKAFKNKETDLEYLNEMETNINRFSDYCFRSLIKKGYSNYKKTPFFYCALFLLESLADEHKYLINYINENKMKLSNELIGIYADINKFYKNLANLFFKFSIESAISLAEEYDDINNNIKTSLKKLKSIANVTLLKDFARMSDLIINVQGQLLNIN